jgi:hypothetical protein
MSFEHRSAAGRSGSLERFWNALAALESMVSLDNNPPITANPIFVHRRFKRLLVPYRGTQSQWPSDKTDSRMLRRSQLLHCLASSIPIVHPQ